MKKAAMAAGLLALGASGASAGDIERSTQSVAILFEEGRYAEVNLGFAMPDVRGSALAGTQRSGSGNMAEDFSTFSLGYKQPLGPDMDVALIIDQPIGADVEYDDEGIYPLAGTSAELRAHAVTALLRYKLQNNVSVYGGLRAQSVKGTARILYDLYAPNTDTQLGTIDYNLETNTDYGFGYVIGVAWEKPEIAARIALTYNSAIDHGLTASETSNVPGLEFGKSDFDTTVPQSVSLEFQTGVAPDTLLFGSVRWVEWSEFLIDPAIYQKVFEDVPLVGYRSDRTTYTLGLGRKFSDSWSGAITASYEPSTGDRTGNLGPNDGFKSIGIGATYTRDAMRITGGLRYVKLGSATTNIDAEFDDNEAVAVGMRVAYTF